MKINRKKTGGIQIGKPPKVKSIAEQFQDNVKLVLSFVTMLILLMQVPWILYVLEPLWVPQTAFDPLMTKRTGVLFQILGNFMPIAIPVRNRSRQFIIKSVFACQYIIRPLFSL